jgi:hypothetical protein
LRELSKKDKLKLRALEAGFQPFEADAFAGCLKRFEEAVRHDERLATHQSVCAMLRQIHDALALSSDPPKEKFN